MGLILRFIFNFYSEENSIIQKIFVGFLLVLVFTSCSTLRDSLILGAGTGVAMGGISGNQVPGDQNENAIKGAVIGGVVGGLASYVIHGSLESRDDRVRRDTLLNLEKFDVMGRGNIGFGSSRDSSKGDKCSTTREVDGRLVSIPCRYIDDALEFQEVK